MNVEQLANRLGDDNVDFKLRCQAAIEIKEAIENVQTQALPRFLQRFVPIFLRILRTDPVLVNPSQLAQTDKEAQKRVYHLLGTQKLRAFVLEIIHRLPPTPDVLQPYAMEIVDLLMLLVENDNEENAVMAIKTLNEYNRVFYRILEDRPQRFLDLMLKIIYQMPETVQRLFPSSQQPLQDKADMNLTQRLSESSGSPLHASSPTTASETKSMNSEIKPLIRGLESFKVIIECPMIVCALLQLHRTLISPNIQAFIPAVKQALTIEAAPQKAMHELAEAKGEIYVDISPDIKDRNLFGDLIMAQVKTMTFFAYIVRIHHNLVQDFIPQLPDIIVRILKDCPRERSSSRKELLVATRHIINFTYRRHFVKRIDDLLDERVLIGQGLTVYETIRPIAYSTLADLIHHVREVLSPNQIRRTIDVYTKNLLDDYPGTSFQSMSAKMLLNMTDCVAKLEDQQLARHFLIAILAAIAEKLAAMNRQYPHAVAVWQRNQAAALKSAHLPEPSPTFEQRFHRDHIDAGPIRTSSAGERPSDPIGDNKFLFKVLVQGLKNLIHGLRRCNPPPPSSEQIPNMQPIIWSDYTYGFQAEEVKVIQKLFREGAKVFRYYGVKNKTYEPPSVSSSELMQRNYMNQLSREEKELLETFATVFQFIDPATFHEIFQAEFPGLHELTFEHSSMLHISQFFLASKITSSSYCAILLQFLMSHLGDVGSADAAKSTVMLKLWKLSCMAVTLYSTENEPVLLPHVRNIILQSIKLSTQAEEPINYYALLRSLFRSIGGGRFEHLYKDILPLLESLLEILNNLLAAARKPQERDLYVELCLTVPARLSNLLPHLNFLMKPLVVALRAGPELVPQGLRTLELCVDNLTADYLDPIINPVIDELMIALWNHLRPMPYHHSHAHTTVRILGKLGGRNRRFLRHPTELIYQPFTDDRCSLNVRLMGSTKDRAFPADLAIKMANDRLTVRPRSTVGKPTDCFYQQQAFNLVVATIMLHVGADRIPSDFARIVRSSAIELISNDHDILADTMWVTTRGLSMAKKRAQETELKSLIRSVMFAMSIDHLQAEATNLLDQLCGYFALLEIGRTVLTMRCRVQKHGNAAVDGPLYLNNRLWAEVIAECLSADDRKVRDGAVHAIKISWEAYVAILGSSEAVEKLRFFRDLASIFCHQCYSYEWYLKAGASLGLSVLMGQLPISDQWFDEKEMGLVRALIFIVKDAPQDLPKVTRDHAKRTLMQVLRRCSHSKIEITDEQSAAKLHALCSVLMNESASANKAVRETAQDALKLLAELSARTLSDLILPVKDRILKSIFAKPLRALPFPSQIGYIEAIGFCMGLGRDLVPMGDEMKRLLLEALALADADEEVLAHKAHEQRTADSVVNLKVACIRLLSMVLCYSDFNSEGLEAVRTRVMNMFFKSMYSKQAEVSDAAYEGLKKLLAQSSKLPQHLLKNGLRPILMNLSDPKRLSTGGLDGLARLLAILPNYFKVEIGTRLLDHLTRFRGRDYLLISSVKLLEQTQHSKIIAAILNVFHLLPAAAVQFMEVLVDSTISVEEGLRRTNDSPFRDPLVRFLSRYPQPAWRFFAARLQTMRYGRFFAQLLSNQLAGPIRSIIKSDAQALIQMAFRAQHLDEDMVDVANINGISLLYAISTVEGIDLTLLTDLAVRTILLEVGERLYRRSSATALNPENELAAKQAGEKVMELFMLYQTHNQTDLDSLFTIINSVALKKIESSYYLIQYLIDKIIHCKSREYQRLIIDRSLAMTLDQACAQKMKTYILHHLVNPILGVSAQEDAEASAPVPSIMNNQLVNQIVCTWKSNIGVLSDGPFSSGIDHTRLEILQLTATVLKHYDGAFKAHRKTIIQLGYSFNKLEDTVNKYAAYVVIAFFISRYECPPDLVMSNYNALLKAYQSEGRSLVTQALDLIADTLPGRYTDRDPGLPRWATLLHKIVCEEGYNLPQLMSIFNFLVRQPLLFYELRDNFIRRIVSSLQKIAPAQTASNENRKLVLNLIELIYKWETIRHGRLQSREGDGTGAETNLILAGASESIVTTRRPTDGSIHPNLRKVILTYLVQMICALAERCPLPSDAVQDSSLMPGSHMQPQELCRRATQLLYNLLGPKFWRDLDIDLFPHITVRILGREWLPLDNPANQAPDKRQEEEKLLNRSINALTVIRIILNTKSDEWIRANLSEIESHLSRALRSNDPKIQECFHRTSRDLWQDWVMLPLLERLLVATVPDEISATDDPDFEPASSPFATFLSEIVTESLAAGDHAAGINILWTLGQRRPTEIDRHCLSVNKVLTLLSRDHVAQGPGTSHFMQEKASRGGDGAGTEITRIPLEPKIMIHLIMKAIEVMALRMSALGDQRRPFLSVLASLVDKSPNIDLCTKILNMVEDWTLRPTAAVPTFKEKTAVLHKMLSFEQRVDKTMLNRFLDLIVRVYEDPEIMRTELTVRLEHAFLIGIRSENVEMRNRFMKIFDQSLTTTFSTRLSYLLTIQNWDALTDSFWIAQVNELMLACIDSDAPAVLHEADFHFPALSVYFAGSADIEDNILDDRLDHFVANQHSLTRRATSTTVRNFIEPMCQLQHVDSHLSSQIWIALFPMCWSALCREERGDLEKGILGLLTKEWHQRQIDRRPNVIQTHLEAIAKASPRVKVPPHVLKFLGRTYQAWYTSLYMLESAVISPIVDQPMSRESTLDALLETYAGLQENDLYYGTWRRRCAYMETNAGLSYEQIGMWDKAQTMYESAQVKARAGAIPFSSGEYMLWEDHWVICAQKLQHWDILGEFAKHENLNDLFLEATWRQCDMWVAPDTRDQLDQIIKGLMDAPTQRRSFFTAFMSLLKMHQGSESPEEFRNSCDTATQLSLKKWHQLPQRITNAHVPILQQFQQIVELQDASIICQALTQTTLQTLEQKSQELKLLLHTWRDRLPNPWDDIESWHDLVTWRQQIFNLVNKAYLPLLPPGQQGTTVPGHSFACRGYHETAWIINKFAHVTRKHEMPEICISQLSRIYTLPNIEIQDAFLKLREQAKCHYQNPKELASGLDVINNTNLNYFANPQKAEFYTLKGMFYAKIGENRIDADEAFGTALQFDIKLAKAWSQWGVYNDNLFKKSPSDSRLAAGAISCYLEAAAILKNGKARKLLGRVLWLLSVDPTGEVAAAFDIHRGDPSPTSSWYWITFIPQLLVSLSQPEARQCHQILSHIAQQFPQALFFQLRTSREDFTEIKKAQHSQALSLQIQQANVVGKTPITTTSQMSPMRQASSTGSQIDGESKQPTPAATVSNGSPGAAAHGRPQPSTAFQNGALSQPGANGNIENASQSNGTAMDVDDAVPSHRKQPWEYADELNAILKSAFPLLALSMETVVDQISKYFKNPPDEDAYRLIVALLNDGISYANRTPSSLADDARLPAATEANITRFAQTILPPHHRGAFEADFVAGKPDLPTYLEKLVKWRDKFEERLDRRHNTESLEKISPHLAEFKFQKFDDVEIPGQYLMLKDGNKDFIKIERIISDIDLVRGVHACYKRLKIRGHDGSTHAFAVQYPAGRYCRREERILQLFRSFNSVLEKKKESRRRNLFFHLPAMIPLTPHIRLVADDASYVSLLGVYEDHCRRNGASRDEPVLFTIRKLKRSAFREGTPQQQAEQLAGLKLETMNAIQESMVPKTVALDYFAKTYSSFDDFWLFRRQFSYQYAAVTFLTYVMHINNRLPHKISIARRTGNIWAAELTSAMAAGRPVFHNPEPVQFRLTPNLQTVMGPMAMEGIYSTSIMTIARCITHAEGRLEHQLSIFVRDEIMFWYTKQHRPPPDPALLREMVEKSSANIVKRALGLATVPEGNLPANQTVIDYISQAVNPVNLSQNDAQWMPYL